MKILIVVLLSTLKLLQKSIKIFIGYDVLLINGVHNVIERNSLFEILATIRYNIIF